MTHASQHQRDDRRRTGATASVLNTSWTKPRAGLAAKRSQAPRRAIRPRLFLTLVPSGQTFKPLGGRQRNSNLRFFAPADSLSSIDKGTQGSFNFRHEDRYVHGDQYMQHVLHQTSPRVVVVVCVGCTWSNCKLEARS